MNSVSLALPTYCHFILASLGTPFPEFVIIAFSKYCFNIRFCRSTMTMTNYVAVFDYNDKLRSSSMRASWIVDGAIFNGKIYVTSSHGKIGVLNLKPPNIAPLEVECIPKLKVEPRLLGYDQKLLLIELNFLKMEWVKMSNCKDQALFLGFITKNSRFMVVNNHLIAPTVLD